MAPRTPHKKTNANNVSPWEVIATDDGERLSPPMWLVGMSYKASSPEQRPQFFPRWNSDSFFPSPQSSCTGTRVSLQSLCLYRSVVYCITYRSLVYCITFCHSNIEIRLLHPQFSRFCDHYYFWHCLRRGPTFLMLGQEIFKNTF